MNISRRVSFIYITGVILAIIIVSDASSQAPKLPDPELQAVLETYHKRAHLLNPILVRYTSRRSDTPAWIKLFPPPKNSWDQASERVDNVLYACKGQKTVFKIDHIKPTPPPGVAAWHGKELLIIDGERVILKSNKENEYIISSRSDKTFIYPVPTKSSREEAVLKTLDEWLNGKMPATSSTRLTSELGDKLLATTITYTTTKWKNKILMLPTKDYVVKSHAVYDQNGYLTNQVDVLDYINSAGIVYPKNIREKHYVSHNVLGYTAELDVESLETDPASISDDLFRYDFPDDAVLYDADRQIIIRRTEATESHLNHLVNDLATPSLWLRWRWMLAIAAAIPCGIVAYRLLVRRIQRNR